MPEAASVEYFNHGRGHGESNETHLAVINCRRLLRLASSLVVIFVTISSAKSRQIMLRLR